MKDQLHKLEVEELELKQKIRRKECNEAPEELFPPPPLPSVTSDAENQSKKRSTKGEILKILAKTILLAQIFYIEIYFHIEIDFHIEIYSVFT